VANPPPRRGDGAAVPALPPSLDPRGPARRGRPGYDLQAVLDVSVRLFNERGYDGTSMEDLAGKLGITKSAIYHHVTSKEELLRLAVARALDGLFAVADEVEAGDGPAIARYSPRWISR